MKGNRSHRQRGIPGWMRRLGHWLWGHWSRRSLVLLLALSVSIRALPYAVPIRAKDLPQGQPTVTFTDRSGLPLGTILSRDQEHAVSVRLDQVSPHFQQAILAAEDGRFYQHGALDLRAIARALLEAARARQIMSGASTITMQLARMIDPAPRTALGKLREIWTSWRLFAGMSRAEILQAYINRLPMGGNIYGIEAAARVYFGVPARDLSVGQASLLAGIPNDPNRLNPYSSWLAARARQTYVLSEMVKDGYLTPVQAKQAEQETLTLQPRQQGILAAPHFLFWLANQLPAQTSQVRTTIDRPLQQFVEAEVVQILGQLGSHHVRHGAVLVLDNQTGEVLAYVGSPDYFADDQLGRNDGVQALRQPGSTLKPFLYQLALEQRQIRPNTILADVPTRYAIPGAQLYTPADYSEKFQGPVRVRVALANSLNIPAVRLIERVGVSSFLDRLHQLGFTRLDQPADHYGLGLALGSGEVSLWQLAQAYLTMARQGLAVPLKPVHTLEAEIAPNSTTALSPVSLSSLPSPTWQLITDMLSDPYARAKAFGVDSLLHLPFPAAVKTGTSSDFRDTWTVGFTRDYTVAVWVGNFDGAPMRQVSGVAGAAPLWQRIMLHLHEQQEPASFEPPAFEKRPICALSGAKPTPACPLVVEEYLFPEDLAAYEQQPDPFYQMVSDRHGNRRSRLTLPEEYSEWLALQPDQPGDRPLQIISPRQGDIFLLEPPTLASTAPQSLTFRLTPEPATVVEWRLNGQLLATQQTSTLQWKPTPGRWQLQVRQGNEQAQVQFEVQPARPRSHRRGFSYQAQ